MKGAASEGWTKRDGLENFIPRDATAVVVTNTGAAWNWSAYSQLIASTPAEFIPHGLHLKIKAAPQVAGLVSITYEYELATGAAAAEVLYSRHTGALVGLTAGALIATGLTWPLGPTIIPSGTRVSARVRISLVATSMLLAIGTYIVGYDQFSPVAYSPYQLSPYLNGVNTAQLLITPSGSTLAITPGARPAYGSWVQIFATAPEDLLVWGSSRVENNFLDRSFVMELGTGAGGSEVARARIGFPSGSVVMNAGVQWLRRPLLVKKGERLVARSSGVAAPVQHQFFYVEAK